MAADLTEVIEKKLLHLERAQSRSLREQLEWLKAELQTILLSHESHCIEQSQETTAERSACAAVDIEDVALSTGTADTQQIELQMFFPDVLTDVAQERRPDDINLTMFHREQHCEGLKHVSEAVTEETDSTDEIDGIGPDVGRNPTEQFRSSESMHPRMSKLEKLQMALDDARNSTSQNPSGPSPSSMTDKTENQNQNHAVTDATEHASCVHFLRAEWVRHLASVLERSNSMNEFSMVNSEGRLSIGSEHRHAYLAGITGSIDEDRFNGCMHGLVLSPVSRKRLSWDLVAMSVTLYDLMMIPLAFFNLPETDFTDSMFWFTFIFWSLDIILAFFTGVQVETGIEMRLKNIAASYTRGWFPVDLLIIAPDWIVLWLKSASDSSDSGGVTRLGKIAKTMRFVRSIRLLRIFRFTRALSGVQDRLKSEMMLNALDFGKLVGGVAFVNHYLSCFWYGIGNAGEQEGWVHHAGVQSSPKEYQYLTSLHWSMTQFHGSMEIYPVTSYERLYAIGCTFLGLVSASLFISSITNLILRMQRLHQEAFLSTRKLLRYLSENHVSPDLTVRIKRFARRSAAGNVIKVTDVEILKTLPSYLLQELYVETKSPTLYMNRLLKRVVYQVPEVKEQLCLEAIAEAQVHSGGLVFGLLERTYQMFVVAKGKVMYYPSSERRKKLKSMNSVQPHGAQSTRTKSRASFTSDARRASNRSMNSSGSSSVLHQLRRQGSNLVESFKTKGFLKAPVLHEPDEIPVDVGSSIAEMNIWTDWEHQGDCMVLGPAAIFSVNVKTFTKVLLVEKYHNVDLALDISHYSTQYMEWLNSSMAERVQEINDLSCNPNLSLDHEFTPFHGHKRISMNALTAGTTRMGWIFRGNRTGLF